jgi:hypothetical protein
MKRLRRGIKETAHSISIQNGVDPVSWTLDFSFQWSWIGSEFLLTNPDYAINVRLGCFCVWGGKNKSFGFAGDVFNEKGALRGYLIKTPLN